MKTLAIVLAIFSVIAFISAIFAGHLGWTFTCIGAGVLLATLAAYIDLRNLIAEHNQMLMQFQPTEIDEKQ